MKNRTSEPKFCVSIAAPNTSKLKSSVNSAFLSGAHLVEIRLDSLNSFSIDSIEELSNIHKNNLVLTFRSKHQGGLSNISESDRMCKELCLSVKPAFMIPCTNNGDQCSGKSVTLV